MWWCYNQSCITSHWAEACYTASGDTLAPFNHRGWNIFTGISHSLSLLILLLGHDGFNQTSLPPTGGRTPCVLPVCSSLESSVWYRWAALGILQAAAEVRRKTVSWAEIYPTPTPTKLVTFITPQGITCSITLSPAVIRLHTCSPNSLPKVGTWGIYNIYIQTTVLHLSTTHGLAHLWTHSSTSSAVFQNVKSFRWWDHKSHRYQISLNVCQ